MGNPRPRGTRDSSTESVEIEPRFVMIANRVLKSPPAKAEIKGASATGKKADPNRPFMDRSLRTRSRSSAKPNG